MTTDKSTLHKHSRHNVRRPCAKCGSTQLYWAHDPNQRDPSGRTTRWNRCESFANSPEGPCGGYGRKVLVDAATGEVHACTTKEYWDGPRDKGHGSEYSDRYRDKEVKQVEKGSWEALYARINALREFVKTREGMEPLDSMRVVLDAKKAFGAGAPADGIISSIMADWSDDTVRQAGEKRFNYADFGEVEPGYHAVSAYVERLIDGGVPTYLHGPAGTGKSSAARKSAQKLGLAYYELNLAGAMASAIRGRDTMNGFIESVFTKAYRDGGVLVLEEIDAAHPNVLTAINNAVANGEWHNEATGTAIKRSGNFKLVATGNTLGTGATKQFTGRMRLDAATLDRFRVGRVHVGHDPALEAHLVS